MAQVLCKVFSFVLVILLGVVTARSGKLGKGADRLISKIVFNLTLPCAIIRVFESYDFNVSLLGLVGLGFAATVIPYFLSLFVYRNKPQQERIVQQLSVCGFNIGCFALAFVQAFFPAGCVVATCLFDAGNSLMGTGGTYALTQTLVLGDDDQSRGQKLKTFCKTLFSSVAFDSYIVLIAMGLLGLKIPAEVITLIDPIANANAFLAMFMVGLMIRFSLTGKKVKELVRLLSWRVIFAIILSIIALKVLPFDPGACHDGSSGSRYRRLCAGEILHGGFGTDQRLHGIQPPHSRKIRCREPVESLPKGDGSNDPAHHPQGKVRESTIAV